MRPKHSCRNNLVVIVDVLFAIYNRWAVCGVNFYIIIANRSNFAVVGIVVDSQKSHLLALSYRSAVSAYLDAYRRSKGHSAKLPIIPVIDCTVGIGSFRNSDFVNMVFAADAFINNLFCRKSSCGVFIAVKSHIYG